MKRQVVLVNSDDQEQGLMEIYRAHANPGVLHRAISVLLFDDQDRLLLQQRSEHKPLWPLYWSNTVCTHPFEGETYLDCAVRRLGEELGISTEPSALSLVYRFEYQADYNAELSEHELDTVVLGRYQGEVEPVVEEVKDYAWVDWQELQRLGTRQIEELVSESLTPKSSILKPEMLTPWFKLILRDGRVDSWLEESNLR